MKVDQYAVDWRDDWDLKELNKFAKAVGGQKCLEEFSQDVVDAKVMYISSRPLTYQEMDELWKAVELWGFDGPVEARTFKDVVKKARHLADVELMREKLVDTAQDHWKGGELERYRGRMWKASPTAVVREYRKCFGNQKVET